MVVVFRFSIYSWNPVFVHVARLEVISGRSIGFSLALPSYPLSFPPVLF